MNGHPPKSNKHSQTKDTYAHGPKITNLATQDPSSRLATTHTLPLAIYPYLRAPYLPIQGHVHSKLQLLHVMSDHRPPLFLRSTSTPPESIQFQPLTPNNWGIHVPLHHLSKLSQSSSLHLVLHQSHFHLLLDNVIPNLVPSTNSSHPTQHPHFWHLQFLDVGVFDWPTLHTIQHGGIDCHSIEFSFKLKGHLLIEQHSRGEPSLYLTISNKVSDIPINLTIPLNHRPNILKTIPLTNILGVQPHHHIILLP